MYKFWHILYLCLLFHIVAFDIKVLLVPWNQFVYTLVIPCEFWQNSSCLHHLWSVYQQGDRSFWKQEESDGVRSGLHEECSKMSQWNCSRSNACVCRTCIVVQRIYSTRELALSARLPNIFTACRKRITPRTSQSARFSIVPWPQLALLLPRDKVRHTTVRGNFQHHTEHQKPMIGCKKIGARTVCANVLYLMDGFLTNKGTVRVRPDRFKWNLDEWSINISSPFFKKHVSPKK